MCTVAVSYNAGLRAFKRAAAAAAVPGWDVRLFGVMLSSRGWRDYDDGAFECDLSDSGILIRLLV